MSAGTLTLTNKSAAVTGSGTAFTTELAAGDFAVVTVGGIPYSLPVKSVNSNTSLTLVSNFTGPSQGGAAWYAVPRVAMNLVTAALVTQSAEALRGLNYDKQNWQAVFTASGTITVKLPDGSTFTGPSWKYLSDNMATKSGGAVPVSQGGTGGTSPSGAAGSLGTAYLNGATVSTGGDMNNFTGVAGSGGEFFNVAAGNSHSVENWPIKFNGNKAYGWGALLNFKHHRLGSRTTQFYVEDTNGGLYFRQNYSDSTWRNWATVWNSGITTVDSNGFIKAASPVVKIYGNGSSQTNEESEGATVIREETGVYRISGVLGMNSDRSWGGNGGGVEVPKDINGQPRVWVDYDIKPDGSIIIRTYHRTYPDAPTFARNLIGTKDDAGNFNETVLNGEPVDIPDDVFISVRVEMPADSVYNRSLLDRQRMELDE
ncbi:MAG: pyocin knob domain-containing protein [Kluyvera sp.]|uniref:pyocin knob domain-containing protein n=1 Tax=Kluyvera sp. TaxID=1538228 RepID=UPI003F310D42